MGAARANANPDPTKVTPETMNQKSTAFSSNQSARVVYSDCVGPSFQANPTQSCLTESKLIWRRERAVDREGQLRSGEASAQMPALGENVNGTNRGLQLQLENGGAWRLGGKLLQEAQGMRLSMWASLCAGVCVRVYLHWGKKIGVYDTTCVCSLVCVFICACVLCMS